MNGIVAQIEAGSPKKTCPTNMDKKPSAEAISLNTIQETLNAELITKGLIVNQHFNVVWCRDSMRFAVRADCHENTYIQFQLRKCKLYTMLSYILIINFRLKK